QWESAEDANFKSDRNFGYYYDGFLKDGYIWVIDDFEPNETKHYEIYVYTKEVSNLEPKVSLQTFGNNYRLVADNITINFAGWNQFLSNQFIINNTSHPLVQASLIIPFDKWSS
ncbi:MAG TPA: hypothetical protein K8V21_05795, partial [Weissella thailandensis]|uniref:hypothetical protein n=1 Tax=Weissella thailandensis TaxID=89061 RepID=UPI001DB6DC97